jgi:hypothetical protein
MHFQIPLLRGVSFAKMSWIILYIEEVKFLVQMKYSVL